MNNDNLGMLDILNILSFIIGVMNYGENLTQGDKQDLIQSVNEKTSILLSEIHQHLNEQDEKINKILEVLNNDN